MRRLNVYFSRRNSIGSRGIVTLGSRPKRGRAGLVPRCFGPFAPGHAYFPPAVFPNSGPAERAAATPNAARPPRSFLPVLPPTLRPVSAVVRSAPPSPYGPNRRKPFGAPFSRKTSRRASRERVFRESSHFPRRTVPAITRTKYDCAETREPVAEHSSRRTRRAAYFQTVCSFPVEIRRYSSWRPGARGK